MDHQVISNPILERFRAAVAATYGDRLERVVLFGSRAHGDYRPDSDYDVAIFLRGYTTRWDELGLLADVTIDILVDTGADISALPFRAGAYLEDRPLMREIARDGLDL